MQQKISEGYTRNREKLVRGFPAASEFLLRIEQQGRDHQLWLSTVQNAHLYRGRMFLVYIGLRNPEQQPPSLYLSPHCHLRIADNTSDRTHLLFSGELAELVEGLDGFVARWAQKDRKSAVELHPDTPSLFFERFFTLLGSLDETNPVRTDSPAT